MPFFDGSLSVPHTSISWPLGSDPTLTWTAAPGATLDHYGIWNANVPDWNSATRLTDIPAGTLTYSPSPPRDGTPEYFWVIGYDASETFAGNNTGVQGCYNDTLATSGDFAPTDPNYPFTQVQLIGSPYDFTSDTPSGEFHTTTHITSIGWTPGNPPYSSFQPPQVSGGALVGRSGGTSFIYGNVSIGDISIQSSGSTVNEAAPSLNNPSDLHNFEFTVVMTSGSIGSWGAPPGYLGNIPPYVLPWSYARAPGFAANGEIVYTSDPSSGSGGGSGGPGGGSGSPSVLGSHGILPPPVPTPLPCVPCCATAAPCG